MSVIRLQFIGGSDLISEIIERVSDGPIAHVDLMLPNGDLLGARLNPDGAPAPGVQIRKPGYKKINYRLVAELAEPYPGAANDFYRNAYKEIGKGYDSEAIAAFAFNRDWRDTSKWFCSEYGAYECELVGCFAKLIAPDNRVPPGVLATVCSALKTTRMLGPFPGW